MASNRRQFFSPYLVVALGLFAVAALVRFGIAPWLNELPANYASETHYAAESRLRETPNGEWEPITLIARRVDQTIVVTSETNIIQGDMHWTTEAGQVIFENTGLYGVDRRTRMNVSGYGDTERAGQFLFPPDVQPTTYRYWDANFIGLRVATFDHMETLEGLTVYVFRFSATGLDETIGYSFLPDVPERYHARTDGQGTLWIEPTSGIMVDYAEEGITYFAEPASGKRVASLFEWSDRYTLETRAAQVRLAADARLRLSTFQVYLPGGLVFAGLIWFGVGLWKWRRNR